MIPLLLCPLRTTMKLWPVSSEKLLNKDILLDVSPKIRAKRRNNLVHVIGDCAGSRRPRACLLHHVLAASVPYRQPCGGLLQDLSEVGWGQLH